VDFRFLSCSLLLLYLPDVLYFNFIPAKTGKIWGIKQYISKLKMIIMTQPKRLSKLVLLCVVTMVLACLLSGPKTYAQYDDSYVSYNDFYENLAPYGQWIEDPQYGYVWSPNEDASFRPYYSNGHWVMTDYGNTWVSDYPWGWACFHYGRWTYDPYYGWLWIPGSNWGPAWVSWRYGEGYYGWAPLGPGYEFATSYGDYMCPNDWWVFIPPQYVYTGNYYRYWYGPRGNSRIIANTTFVNNTYRNNNVTYVSGPRSRDIENITHQPVQVYRISNSRGNLNTRVRHDVIKMYRPAEIRPVANINGQRVTPPNVVRAPQPVSPAQSVNSGQATPPQFRTHLPQQTETPGTNFNHTAEPRRTSPRSDNNPYEWDVNRPVRQPQQDREPGRQPEQGQMQRNWGNQLPRQEPPRQTPQPQPQRQAPTPPPAQPRQAPQPQPQQQRQAPAPNQRESGRR